MGGRYRRQMPLRYVVSKTYGRRGDDDQQESNWSTPHVVTSTRPREGAKCPPRDGPEGRETRVSAGRVHLGAGSAPGRGVGTEGGASELASPREWPARRLRSWLSRHLEAGHPRRKPTARRGRGGKALGGRSLPRPWRCWRLRPHAPRTGRGPCAPARPGRRRPGPCREPGQIREGGPCPRQTQCETSSRRRGLHRGLTSKNRTGPLLMSV